MVERDWTAVGCSPLTLSVNIGDTTIVNGYPWRVVRLQVMKHANAVTLERDGWLGKRRLRLNFR